MAVSRPVQTPETHEISVRAHAVIARKERVQFALPQKWPEEVLVIDTETTIDTSQRLTFGAYRRCKLTVSGYQCLEEGLFCADDLDAKGRAVLDRYIHDPRNVPQSDVKIFPPPMRLNLYSRSDFVRRVFWKRIRKPGAMIVGFNLPFDLSRLAVKSSPAADGGLVAHPLITQKPQKRQD